MTSRERIIAAMSHREPDRTPVFERIIKSPHSDALLGRPCAATNFDLQMAMLADDAHDELCRQDARDRVELANLLGFDMIALGPNGGPPAERPVRLAPGQWRMGNSIAEQTSSGWVRWTSVDPPPLPGPEEQQARDLEAWLETAPPSAPPPDGAFIVFDEAKRIMAEESLHLAIYSSCYGIPVCALPPVYLEWFHTRPELLRRYYRRLSDGTVTLASACAARGAHIIGLGGDVACDAGPVISPAHYHGFIVPEIRRQAEAVHALSAYATNTSDGNLWPILDDFLLATGVDGFGEIDIVAGMDLRRLKAQYGSRICLIGNLDIRFVLTRGTPEECARHTRECIEAGAGSGGHILMTSNVVHEDVCLGNYLACLAAYRDHFGLERLPL